MNLQELYKILLDTNSSQLLSINRNRLFDLIPGLELCTGFDQHNEWHKYDVFEHTLHVVDNVDTNIVLRLAALFHDIGKPLAYQEDENGVGHFHGHWEISKKMFDQFATSYKIDPEISSMTSKLIYYHDLNIGKLNDKQIKKLYDELGLDGIELLFKLKKADLLAHNEKFHYILKDYEEQKQKILLKNNPKEQKQ